MYLNELKLNHDKTEIMLFHSKFRAPPLVQSLRVGSANVPLSSSARSLGVIFDDTMSFNAHLSDICKSSFYHLHNISKIRKYINKESAATVVHAFVTSKLDYCNSLFFGLPKYQSQRLQYVQNTAAGVLIKAKMCAV